MTIKVDSAHWFNVENYMWLLRSAKIRKVWTPYYLASQFKTLLKQETFRYLLPLISGEIIKPNTQWTHSLASQIQNITKAYNINKKIPFNDTFHQKNWQHNILFIITWLQRRHHYLFKLVHRVFIDKTINKAIVGKLYSHIIDEIGSIQ